MYWDYIVYSQYRGGLKWKLCYKKSRALASARVPPLVYRVSQKIVKLYEIILWIMHCNYTIYKTLSRSWGSLDALAPPSTTPSTPEHRRYRWVWTKILSTFLQEVPILITIFSFNYFPNLRSAPKTPFCGITTYILKFYSLELIWWQKHCKKCECRPVYSMTVSH